MLYANYNNTDFLHVPLYFQYELVKDLGIQAGPQVTIVLDDPFGTVHEFGLDLGFGFNYDLSDNVFLNTRYALELGNRATEELDAVFGEDGTLGVNSFMFGLGYRF